MVNRDTILDALVPWFRHDKRLILLVCDCGFARIDNLKAEFPDRVINMGVMEQGTVGIAAGMAHMGLIPIVFSIAKFIVYRALEQLRDDVVMMRTNVKVIGQGSGDFFRHLGKCHWCGDDDIKLMNIIGMPVYTASGFTSWINSRKGGYIRV